MGGLLVLLGSCGLVVGVVGAARGHLKSARIGSRRAGVAVAAGALIVMVLGGALLPNPAPAAKRTAATTAAVTTSAAPAAASTPSAPGAATSSPRTPLPATSPAASSRPVAAAGSSASSLRGVMNLVTWWTRRYPAVSTGVCTADGYQPIGTERAWQLPSGAVACYDDQTFNDTWKGAVINVDVFFPERVPEAEAVAVGAELLPTDSRHTATFDGVNNDTSAKPNGSCRQVVYTSAALRSAVAAVDPGWSDPDKASIDLYSGAATPDGSQTMYSPSRIHLAMVGIGGENRGSDGVVHC